MSKLKRKYGLLLLILSVGLLLVISGCGGGSQKQEAPNTEKSEAKSEVPTSNSQPANKVTISFSSPFPASDYRHRSYQWFVDEVEKRTNGEVKINIHPSGSLVTVDQAFQALSAGTVDMATLPSSYMSNQVKEMALFDIPGSYNPEKWKELEKEARPIFQKIFDSYNIQYLFSDYESDSIVTLRSGEPIKMPEDWKGHKIRDYGTLVGRTIEAWGGTPVHVALQELSSAVQNGTVDGVLNGWPVGMSFKVYETTPLVSNLGLSVLWHPIAINKNAWNKLSPAQQAIFNQVGQEAGVKSEEYGKEDYNQFLKLVQEANATMYVMNAAERQAHLEAIQPLLQEVADSQTTEEGKALAEIVKKYR